MFTLKIDNHLFIYQCTINTKVGTSRSNLLSFNKRFLTVNGEEIRLNPYLQRHPKSTSNFSLPCSDRKVHGVKGGGATVCVCVSLQKTQR